MKRLLFVLCVLLVATLRLDAECPTDTMQIAAGVVDAADHESASGFFNIGKFSIAVPPDGMAALTLRQFKGRDVRILLVPVEPRKRAELER